ncbi:hypothetical protein VKT23_013988 [Stygiomarasmius scandens]|uniref:Uncharacterized protein n=1 Tax=Marasmiellus scandens TaxID=2682957 RepID=A0ABR1J4A4_9AGAR
MGRHRKSNIRAYNEGTEPKNAGKRKASRGIKDQIAKKQRIEKENAPAVPARDDPMDQDPDPQIPESLRSPSPLHRSPSALLEPLNLQSLPEQCSTIRYQELKQQLVETGILPTLDSLPDPQPFNPIPYSPTTSISSLSTLSSPTATVFSMDSPASSPPSRKLVFKAPVPPQEELALDDEGLWMFSTADFVSDTTRYPINCTPDPYPSDLYPRPKDNTAIESDDESVTSCSDRDSDIDNVDEDNADGILSLSLSMEALQLSDERVMPSPPAESTTPPSPDLPRHEWYHKNQAPPVEAAAAAYQSLFDILHPR